MRILICGDSWAADHQNNLSWTRQLAKLLDCEVNSFAQRGCSNYLIYNQYRISHPEKYDIAIIIKSSNYRIPYVNKHPHLCSYFPNIVSDASNLNLPKDYPEALEGYLKYYFNKQFLDWATSQSFKSIEDIKPPSQKIIWISAFYDGIEHHSENSVNITGRLNYITDKQINMLDGTGRYDSIEVANHLSTENNYNLAVFLKNVILDPNANRDLEKHDWTWIE